MTEQEINMGTSLCRHQKSSHGTTTVIVKCQYLIQEESGYMNGINNQNIIHILAI